MGTLANFTLSKRREILEKSSVNEILQDSLRLITNWGRFPDRRVMDFKIFILEITGKKLAPNPEIEEPREDLLLTFTER
jgi:hypothetical protein